MKRKIIFSDNGSHTDFTEDLNNYYSGQATLSIVSSQDTIFIGSVLPFNHFYVLMGDRTNSISSTLGVRHWDGNDWEDVAQVIDSTSTGGATLGKSGFVEFVPRKNKGFGKDDTIYDSTGNERITGLGTTIIYDRYWTALHFSNSLTSNINIKWIGQIFSDDNDLGTEFPDLTRDAVRQAISSTKSSYQEQAVYAADVIAKDLIFKNIISGKDQILYREDLRYASVSKVAEMIYSAFGDDYKDDKEIAAKEYANRLNAALPKIDTNSDGRLDDKEVFPTSGRLYR